MERRPQYWSEYCRGEILAMASINRRYNFVTQKKHHLDRFRCQETREWILSVTNRPDNTAALTSIDCELALAQVHDNGDID
jgi:hypothetical protein